MIDKSLSTAAINLYLLGTRVLIEPEQLENPFEKYEKAGLALPENAKELYLRRAVTGRVIGLGAGLKTKPIAEAIAPELGLRVLFDVYSGMTIDMDIGAGKREYRIMPWENIVGVLSE